MVGRVRRGADGGLVSRRGPPTEEPRPPGLHAIDTGAGTEARWPSPSRRGRDRCCCSSTGPGAAAGSLARVGQLAAEQGVHVLAPTAAASTWDLLIDGLGRDVAAIDAALAAVYDSQQVTRTAIGGFSDGGSYALSLGVANGGLFDAVLAFIAAPRQEGRPRVRV